MPALSRSWHLLGILGLSLCALLAGCASAPPPPPPPPDALLQDALFGTPPRPADADAVLTLSPAMRAHLEALRGRIGRSTELPMALAQSLYQPGGLRLDYDASITRNAAEAFAARSGNCLSLVVMTAALADALGLEVGFQQVLGDDPFRREGGLTLRNGHVNVVLLPPVRQPAWGVRADAVRRGLLIDFLPPETAAALQVQPIGRERVLAMFMNNRAVESLLAQQPAQAYAWAREALRTDPGFAAAWNTLGVVYQRRAAPGDAASALALDAAAAAYDRVLALDAHQAGTMDNLAQVRRLQGREAEARGWDQRRAALEPWPPLHFLRLGDAALAAQDWPLARRLFERELRRQPDLTEAWFGLARAQLALGDRRQADEALQRARATSLTPAEQARFAGKLDALRAQAPN